MQHPQSSPRAGVPHISLHTKDITAFSWTDEYTGLTDGEIGALLLESRHAVTSLEAELERRRVRNTPSKPDEVDDCLKRLNKLACQVKVLGRLDEKSAKHVQTAVGALKAVQTARGLKVYQEFLKDILRHCGPGLVLLCAASLGKHKVANLKADNRVQLLDRVIRAKQQFDLQLLCTLAATHGVPTADSPSNSTSQEMVPASSRGNLDLLAQCQYCSFSFMRHPMMDKLPEPFRAGVMTSNLWREEQESGGLPVTNCLSIYLPEIDNEDALFVARISYHHGFGICDSFGLGEAYAHGT